MRYLKNIHTLIKQEKCIRKIAGTVALGVFIAFSPFVGLHTVMVFVLSWLFAVNAPLVLAISFFINNPWTMGPVYAADYFFGNWLFDYYHIQQLSNPFFVSYLNNSVQQYVAMPNFNFWTFLIGGNLLAILLGIFSYFFVKYVGRLMQKDYKISLPDPV